MDNSFQANANVARPVDEATLSFAQTKCVFEV